LYGFVGNEPANQVDPWGLKIIIDVRASSEFASWVAQCLAKLREAPRGNELYQAVRAHPSLVVIKPSVSGAESGSPLLPVDGWKGGPPKNTDVWLHPWNPNGLSPSQEKNAGEGQAPPRTLAGCASVLAHEFGHLLGDKDENQGGQNVQKNENPVRLYFDIRPRKHYYGTPVIQEPYQEGE
jgi:hypothetical protein